MVKTGLWPKNDGQERVKHICRKLIYIYYNQICTENHNPSVLTFKLLSNSNLAIIALSGIPLGLLLKINQCKAMIIGLLLWWRCD